MRIQCHNCNIKTYSVLIDDILSCVNCESGFVEEIVEQKSEETQQIENLTSADILQIVRIGFTNVIKTGLRENYGIDLDDINSPLNQPIVNFVWDQIERYSTQNDNEEIRIFRETIVDSGTTSPPQMTALSMVYVTDMLTNYINVPSSGQQPVSKNNMTKLSRESYVLKSSELSELKDQSCAVCKSEYSLGERCSKILCNHIFHTKCITPWFKNNNTCPICRKKFPTDNIVYNRLNNL